MAQFGEAKIQTYMRVLAYAKPYKWRLTVGILAGFVVGGSLFGSIMMLPGLVSSSGMAEQVSAAQTKSASVKIVKAVDSAATESEKVQSVEKLIGPGPREADRIAKEVVSFNKTLDRIGITKLRAAFDKGTVSLKNAAGKILLDFPAETQSGRMTWQFFALFCFGFVLLWIIKNIATYVNHYCMRYVGARVVTDLRAEIFRKLSEQSLRFYSSMDVGQLISRSNNDTAAIDASVADVIADATRCPIEILACAAAVVYASVQHGSWSLPLILFVGLPACVVPVAILGRKIRKAYKRAFNRVAEIVSRMHEVFTSILVVKAYHTEEREIRRFNDASEKYFRTVIKALRFQLMMAPLMETVAVIATLVFLGYSFANEVSLVELVQLLAPCFLAYRPIKDLARISTSIQRSMAAADRYFQVIDTDTALRESPHPLPFTEFNDRISLKNVTFAYDTRKILDGITFDIPKGSVVAAVGATGSGKTTIANLIARFYDCDSGSVTFDGKNVREIRIADLRNMIGVVTQDALLFNDSIASNIAYGAPDATREQIIEAAKQANAHEFIVDGRHPEGYDTVVGEKGFRLSGGEKQRIAIARAILKNPPILILDEATSALDTVTEKLVQDALNKVMANRTVFAIAHRLSTIRSADCILVLENGKIVEFGTHENLIALGGRYKKLCDTQFKMMES